MSIKRGQIYFVTLDPVQGREQAGKRPVLVLSIDEINDLPLVVTVNAYRCWRAKSAKVS
jgi:mRNA interferase MazF